MNMGFPCLLVGEPILLIHALSHNAQQRSVIYDVVIVRRNLVRINENEGFKMTALEYNIFNIQYLGQ